MMDMVRAANRGGPLAMRSALDQISRRLEKQPDRQVHESGDHPPRPGYIVRPIEAPTRILVVDSGVVGGGATSVGIPVDFSGPGFGEVIGLAGSMTDGAGVAAALESMAMRIEFNGGDEELITTGRVQAFANMGALFNNVNFYLPIRRRVSSTDTMNFYFQNLTAAANRQGFVLVYFKSDRDIIRELETYAQDN